MPPDDPVDCSRRRLVAGGVLLSLLAPAIGAALPAPNAPRSPPLAGAPPLQDAGSASRTADDAMGHMTAAAAINGSGPYHFMVDSGAERSVIAEDLAMRLGLPGQGEALIEGLIRTEPTRLVLVRQLAFGGLVCPHLQVPTLPRAALDADGYLGLDVIDNHRLIMNFAARTLTITRPQGFFASLWRGEDEVLVHTMGPSGRLRSSDCHVDGVHATAFIDTGAAVSVANSMLYDALRLHSPAMHPIGAVQLGGVTGGSVNAFVVGVREVALGHLTLTRCPLAVANLQVFRTWGLVDQPALLLGINALRRLASVSIDYGRKELRFELAGSPWGAAESHVT